MTNTFEVRSAIEITKFNAVFLNPKRISLLKLVRDTGSIHAASKELKMSYQQAWQFISEMNEVSPLPLVVRNRGGVNGGGTRLTEFGEKAITGFENLSNAYAAFNEKMSKDLWICSLF